MDFCHNLPCSPEKLLRTAYGVRNFSSSEMDRLFIKTEMYLKSKAAASASMPNNKNVMVPRSRSSDVLPSSQSQVNIQMMSHTLTIREVNSPDSFYTIFFLNPPIYIKRKKVFLVKLLMRCFVADSSLSFFNIRNGWGFDRVPGHLVLGLDPWDCSRFRAFVPKPPTTIA